MGGAEAEVLDEVGPVSGHTLGIYESNRIATLLLGKVATRVRIGNRNAIGFWLACQMRDNRVDKGVAVGTMLVYRRFVPQDPRNPYTVGEAMRSLWSAYKREPREPWGA